MRPDFLIAGAPKAGTTALYHALRSHPEVFLPDMKEPDHFLSEEAMRTTRTRAEYDALFASLPGGVKAAGEASVNYLYDEGAAQRIRDGLGGGTRILLLLRDPATAAFSLWRHNARTAGENLAFTDAVAAEERRRAGNDVPRGALPARWYLYTERVCYAPQVKRFLDAFPAEQVRISTYEEFFEDAVTSFADVCRFLGVTEGVMQKGHMRFEPNINLSIELDDGKVVKTPIVEIKNLNSFRALKGAVEYEQKHQAARWQEDGKEMGPGAKTTRGWDDSGMRTFVQREKEDAHDYRYFPDPDLLPVRVSEAWLDRVRDRLPELPHDRAARYRAECGLSAKEAAALVDERDVSVPGSDTVVGIHDHSLVLLESDQRTVVTLDTSGQRKVILRAMAEIVHVTVSPYAPHLALATTAGRVYVYDVRSGREMYASPWRIS